MAQRPDRDTSSTGQIGTGGDWLDIHFEASRLEYEVQLRAVGIKPGWHVLDAACGTGPFLPWLTDLVGSEGRLTALDLAPDNVAAVERRAAGWQLSCPVETRVGNVLAIPYPDDNFDAVWFANTTAYLTDEELNVALTELRRVVRPGGLVAIKEIDGTMNRVVPAPPGLTLRMFQVAANAGSVQMIGHLRTPLLPGWLRRAGLVDIWRRTILIERTSPLDPPSRAAWHGALTFFAACAADLELPLADREVWARLRDPAGLERFLDDPDCSLVEGNLLTVGRVP